MTLDNNSSADAIFFIPRTQFETLPQTWLPCAAHSGNFVVMSGGAIRAMNFGLVGELTERDLLPRTGRRRLEKAEQNELFEVGLKDTGRLLSGLNRLVNRHSLSIVIAGLVVSLAILIAVTAAGSPLQILVVVGFLATLGLGIWLLISILRGTS